MAVDLLRTLSVREIEILTMVVFGYGHHDIFLILGVKNAQVDKLINRLYQKCRVEDIVGLTHIYNAYEEEFRSRLNRKNSLVIPLTDSANKRGQLPEPPFLNDDTSNLLDEIRERAENPWLEDDEELRQLILNAADRGSK